MGDGNGRTGRAEREDGISLRKFGRILPHFTRTARESIAVRKGEAFQMNRRIIAAIAVIIGVVMFIWFQQVNRLLPANI